jgi:hypothetical protein
MFIIIIILITNFNTRLLPTYKENQANLGLELGLDNSELENTQFLVEIGGPI